MSTLHALEPISRPAPRVAAIPPSCVHEVFRAVADWQDRTGREVIRLHVGEPYFRPPATVAAALTAAVRDGRTNYGGAEGLPELREALAAKLESRNRHRTSPDMVFVTPGSSQGLAALMQAVANPGDELLLPALHWPVHLQQCLLAGLRPVCYPLDSRFRPDLEALRRLDGDRSRVLLVNTPANPSGAVCDQDYLRALLDLARQRSWQVISDEAYEDFVFDGEHISMAALERDVPPAQRIVSTTFSFSKSYAMTGYRLGYVVTPNRQLAAAMRVVQQASIVCPATPVQYAGLAALDAEAAVEHNRAHVLQNRRLLRPLAEAGLLAHYPEGGWYAVLDVGRTGQSAVSFADSLLETHAVALAPAAGFALRPRLSADNTVLDISAAPEATRYLRLAFCGETEALRRAVRRIAEFAVSTT